ncbi:MAG: thioesterase family protein [Pseudomonadota bacterium]
MILDRAALEAKGVKGWALGFEDTVRYRDLDTYNHVNNVVFHSWFEDIRVMFLEYLDLKLQEENTAMPVMRTADISFDRQLLPGAKFMVLTKPKRIGTSSFTLAYQVQSEGIAVVQGSSVIVMSDLAAGKPVALTEKQRQAISAYL